MTQHDYIEQMLGRQAIQISLLASQVDELREANAALAAERDAVASGKKAPQSPVDKSVNQG